MRDDADTVGAFETPPARPESWTDPAHAAGERGAWSVTAEDVALIARGAAVLGSGGGGDPYLGQLLALDAVRRGEAITIIPPDRLDDDALVIAIGQIGTSTVFAERLARGGETDLAIATLERYLNKRAAAVMCYEIGGINSMVPLVVGALRGLPVVNADIMGRAFPELQMTTLDMYGAPPAPVALCDDRGNVTIVAATEDMFWTERLARALTLAMGGLAYVARPVPRAADLKARIISGSYSRARALGVALRRVQQDGTLDEIARAGQDARVILRGIITGVERRTAGRFTRGTVTVQGDDGASSGAFAIEFQNEHLVVRHGLNVLATVPDVICVLDEETGEVVYTEALSAGLRVVVIGLPAVPQLTTPAALRLVGPSAFDYDLPIIPSPKVSPENRPHPLTSWG